MLLGASAGACATLIVYTVYHNWYCVDTTNRTQEEAQQHYPPAPGCMQKKLNLVAGPPLFTLALSTPCYQLLIVPQVPLLLLLKERL